MKIDGKQIASYIYDDLKLRITNLKNKGVIPHLYIILLSDDPSSESYVKQKILHAGEIGIKITLDKENPAITTDDLVKKIQILNNDNTVHGIIVQRPLPEQTDNIIIANSVNPQKDVDGFNENSKFKVPVAIAVTTILKQIIPQDFENQIRSKRITILGKGITAGMPIINSLRNLGANLDIVDSKTQNKEFFLQNSDIIISAVGKLNVIKATDIKKGAILIGVGLHKEPDGKFYGDYNEEEIANIASFYTPTPGGVGPVNVASLLLNVVIAAENL